MTLPGIITMLLSIGFVWILLIVCMRRLLRSEQKTPARVLKKNPTE